MSVYGIGCDIVDVSRIKKALINKNFRKKIFSKSEIKTIECKANKVASYAKKFAAKEALSKALSTGLSRGISFKDISINNDKKGKPYITLVGKTKSTVRQIIKKKYKIFISISDEQKYALAMVVITRL